MKIEKLPSGSYRIRKTVNKQAYCVTFDHKPGKKEAEQAMQDMIKDSGTHSGTFQAFAEDFLRINDNILKPATLRGYCVVLRGLSDKFKKSQLRYITNADIQKELNRVAIDHSPKTCANYRGFISTVMAMYRPEFRVNVNVPARPHYDKYVPTAAEVQAVLDEVRGTQFEIVYRLLMYGVRRGEACALTLEDLSPDNFVSINKAWSQSDDQQWHLMSTPKTESSNRRVQIDDELADLIRAQGYIYKGSICYLNKKLHKIQKKLGQPSWRLHDYRAYMASELDAAHVPESTILAVGGWSTPNIMKAVYRKSRYEQDEKARDDVKKILYQSCIENSENAE